MIGRPDSRSMATHSNDGVTCGLTGNPLQLNQITAPEHVNVLETHYVYEFNEQMGVMVGGLASFLGGLIQTASGTLGSRGAMPLKRVGCAAKAVSSVTPRCAASAVDRPQCTVSGDMSAMPE
jgi:hypothetical protein